DPATFQLIAAGLTFIPALVWAVMAQAISRFTRKRGSKGTVQRVLLALTCLVAMHYALWSLFPLLASHLRGEGNRLSAVLLAASDTNVVALMAAARHFVLLWPIRAEAPRRGWLAVNYGSALVAATFFVLADLRFVHLPEHGLLGFFALFTGYFVVLAALCMQDVFRLARCGAWRPGRLAEHSLADALTAALGFLCVLAGVLAPGARGIDLLSALAGWERSPAVMSFFVLHAAGGILIAVPFVVRDLGEIPRRGGPARRRRDRRARRLPGEASRAGLAARCDRPAAQRLRARPVPRAAPPAPRRADRGRRRGGRAGRQSARPLGAPLRDHRPPRRQLQRPRRRGARCRREPAGARARRGPAADARRGRRALARPRRAAGRHRRDGGAHRARHPQPGDGRAQPRPAARPRGRRAVRHRACDHPRRARAGGAAGRGPAALRPPRGLPPRGGRRRRARTGRGGDAAAAARGGGHRGRARPRRRRRGPRRSREAAAGARQPARERDRRARGGGGPEAPRPGGRRRQRHCQRSRRGQRSGCARRGPAASLRAFLLAQGQGDGARARHRQADDRRPWRADRGGRRWRR